MIAEPVKTPAAPAQEHHLTFFRQSGWMMIASTLGGGLMYCVHMVAQRMPKEEYGVFMTMLQTVALMGIPSVGLQGVFMQQAAASLNPEHERELAGVFRGVLRATALVWLLMAATVLFFRNGITNSFGISNPATLWITVGIGLLMLWRPVVFGVMQGRQNFLWCGWSAIGEGATRFLGVCLFVGVLGAYAAGALSAVLLGSTLVIVIGGWFSRDCLTGPADPMNWRRWLARVVPLTLGLGVGTFMLSADMIFVQKFFSKQETGYYAAAGMIGRALIYFTAPLTAVMFPKVARGAALGQGTNALKLTLLLTLLAGGSGAVICSIFPELPLRLVYDKSFLAISTPLVPWFAWCMLPLTLSTVLINSLMASSRFSVVPWLLAVAGGYALSLYLHHDTFKVVIQTIGIFGSLLVGVCAWFTWGPPARSKTA
ncbi:MAG: hypothetical protein U1F98_13520 [Verrucomicrobiota bacterium]